jgi:anti-anti-sigma factor
MPPTDFGHLHKRLEQGVCVLTLTDAELHGDEANRELQEELVRAVAELESPKVALDFQRVRFIAAAGLRALLQFRRHIRERDGQLLLCGLDSDVADVFYSTHLASDTPSALIPFAMAPDAAAAVAHLRKQ